MIRKFMNKLPALVLSLFALLSLMLSGCAISKGALQEECSNVKGGMDTVKIPVVLTMNDSSETMDATARVNVGNYTTNTTTSNRIKITTEICLLSTVSKTYAEDAEEGNLDISLSYGLYDYETGEMIMMADLSEEASDDQSCEYSLLEENDTTCEIECFERENYGGTHNLITKSYDIGRQALITINMPEEAEGHQFALVFFSQEEDGSQAMSGAIVFGEKEGTFTKWLHYPLRESHHYACGYGAVRGTVKAITSSIWLIAVIVVGLCFIIPMIYFFAMGLIPLLIAGIIIVPVFKGGKYAAELIGDAGVLTSGTGRLAAGLLFIVLGIVFYIPQLRLRRPWKTIVFAFGFFLATMVYGFWGKYIDVVAVEEQKQILELLGLTANQLTGLNRFMTFGFLLMYMTLGLSSGLFSIVLGLVLIHFPLIGLFGSLLYGISEIFIRIAMIVLIFFVSRGYLGFLQALSDDGLGILAGLLP